MEVGLVQKINIDQEMQQAYLDYAMSVIVARALPDARDGLKPVHRRILYAMYDMGLRSDSTYKKSARIVGEVLGKYHPHGDAAVYDAMARMVQSFSMRYPLVDGQGNFGSIDGDSPAAMRYTEARMASPTMEMISDIRKDTVDFTRNFDETLSEPEVLPSAIPNLLINGGTGIAVGMATNIPPHNLGEVVDALIFMLDRWTKVEDISVEELMQFVKGPDFPTGGVILRDPEEDRLTNAYSTGRGRVLVQAQAHIEEMGRGRQRIIVTELPYMTNKASLIGRIAKLAREGDLEGISDLRDESDRQGMRIVIELTKTADPDEVLRVIYRRTPMQSTFSIIMLALVNGEPRLLSLRQALRVYLEHRLEVIRRRSEFDLAQARSKAHILEGLRIALQNLEEIIELIRKSADVDKARTRLQRSFDLSEEQAQAILDMPLRRLAALERRKIETEYKEMLKSIKELELLLGSPRKMRYAIVEELLALKETFGDRRRTRIVQLKTGAKPITMLTTEDIAPSKNVWVAVTKNGLISRTAENKLPRLSGRNAPYSLLRANTRDTLYLVTKSGKTAAIPVHTVPETDSTQKGVPVDQICPLSKSEAVVTAFSLPTKSDDTFDGFVLTTTRGGLIKKTPFGDLPGPAAQAFKLVNVKENDQMGWVRLTDGNAHVLLVSAGGMAIRFAESEVRPMGLSASGVMGIKLKTGDELIGSEIITESGEVLLFASDGAAKRVAFNRFPKQGRYGQGVAAWKISEGEHLVGVATGKETQRVTVHLAHAAAKAVRLDAIPVRTRPAQGKIVIEVKPSDRITTVSIPRDPPDFETSKPAKSPKRKRVRKATPVKKK